MLKVNEWTELYQTISKYENQEITILTSEKITFKIESISRDKEEYVIMIK